LTFCPFTGRISTNLLADALLAATNPGLAIFSRFIFCHRPSMNPKLETGPCCRRTVGINHRLKTTGTFPLPADLSTGSDARHDTSRTRLKVSECCLNPSSSFWPPEHLNHLNLTQTTGNVRPWHEPGRQMTLLNLTHRRREHATLFLPL